MILKIKYKCRYGLNSFTTSRSSNGNFYNNGYWKLAKMELIDEKEIKYFDDLTKDHLHQDFNDLNKMQWQ